MAAFLLTLSACAPRARVPVEPMPPAPAPIVPPRVAQEASFVATAYCHDGKTASGAHTRTGIVAADPDVLPIGTRIRVNGLTRGRDGVYRVMDTGTHVQGRRIDLFVTSCAEAKRFGTQHVRVAVVR
jgi:3D (Asp-Asp-Asp) domain-containing protein